MGKARIEKRLIINLLSACYSSESLNLADNLEDYTPLPRVNIRLYKQKWLPSPETCTPTNHRYRPVRCKQNRSQMWVSVWRVPIVATSGHDLRDKRSDIFQQVRVILRQNQNACRMGCEGMHQTISYSWLGHDPMNHIRQVEIFSFCLCWEVVGEVEYLHFRHCLSPLTYSHSLLV